MMKRKRIIKCSKLTISSEAAKSEEVRSTAMVPSPRLSGQTLPSRASSSRSSVQPLTAVKLARWHSRLPNEHVERNSTP